MPLNHQLEKLIPDTFTKINTLRQAQKLNTISRLVEVLYNRTQKKMQRKRILYKVFPTFSFKNVKTHMHQKFFPF